MDKGSLLMTHYCAAGNQPRMKLNPRTSTANELVFDFAGGTNLNPRRDVHMHIRHTRQELPAVSELPTTLIGPGQWAGWTGGPLPAVRVEAAPL